MLINLKIVTKSILMLSVFLLILITITSCETKIAEPLYPDIDYVIINPHQVTMARRSRGYFTAIVYGQDNTAQNVNWSVSGNNSPDTGFLTPFYGLLDIGEFETASQIIVRATSRVNPSKYGETTVYIPQPQPPIPPQYMDFGGINWRVLYRDDVNNRALIITRDIIDRMQHGSYNSWELSSIRTYLNGEYYQQFSLADQARIQTTINLNPDNELYGTPGGNPTSDKIFLLSIDEARRYFASDNDRIARLNGGPITTWWLRSPGQINNYGRRFSIVEGLGAIDETGVATTNNVGIRPALWINL